MRDTSLRVAEVTSGRVSLSILETRSPRGWLGAESFSMVGEDLPPDTWWGDSAEKGQQ